MRALIIGKEVEDKVRQQVAWANLPANRYHPDRDSDPPGDNPAYVLMLEDGFRTVYTYTVTPQGHFRHLSISIEGDHYPNPIAVWTIAAMFGFTGGLKVGEAYVDRGPDWIVAIDRPRCAVVLAQQIS